MICESAEFGRRTFESEDGNRLTVVIHVPEQDKSGCYSVKYSLNGLIWSGKSRVASGIDQIQAIYIALQSIGSDLNEFESKYGIKLSWVGGKGDTDLGLPKIDFQNL